MGECAADTEDYATQVIEADFEAAGDDDVIAKLRNARPAASPFRKTSCAA